MVILTSGLILLLSIPWHVPGIPFSLPTPQPHPLPQPLAQWHDQTDAGDYFTEIKLTPVEYLVWSEFPVQVYIEHPKESAESSASAKRFHDWYNAVLQAVEEWTVYLPLQVVSETESADITIVRSRPPLQASFNRETQRFENIRARTAETRYEFYPRPGVEESQRILAHKFTIYLSPHQTVDYTLATARHELGHALGIWGHSPVETDTMYYSQVRYPPEISVRDINTLKRIYQQPTCLGWVVTSTKQGKAGVVETFRWNVWEAGKGVTPITLTPPQMGDEAIEEGDEKRGA